MAPTLRLLLIAERWPSWSICLDAWLEPPCNRERDEISVQHLASIAV